MWRRSRCDYKRGRIEGKFPLVVFVALRAVRQAVRRTIRVEAPMRIAAGIESLDGAMRLRRQLHHACARRRHGVVREEYRGKNN